MPFRSNKTWLVLLVLCALAGLWWYLMRSGKDMGTTVEKQAELSRPKGSPKSTPDTEEAGPAMSASAVATVLKENAVPGHVVFLNFWVETEGLRLVSARGAAGRAGASWTPGLRRGVLVYELRDQLGAVMAEGEVEDPLNRRLEYEAPGGNIASTWVSLESSELMLRIPGVPSPTSIEFYRGAAEDPARRVSIGRIQLQ